MTVLLVAVVVLSGAAGAGLLLRKLSAAPGGADDAVPEHATAVRLPSREPGSMIIELAKDVAAHPQAQRVRVVLQSHFDAINTADYDLWTRTVTAERVRTTSSRAWSAQYRTTLDGDVVVRRLEARPGGGLIAFLSFTSVQDPADAPPDLPVRCLRWRVSYPLLPAGDELRVGRATPHTSLYTRC